MQKLILRKCCFYVFRRRNYFMNSRVKRLNTGEMTSEMKGKHRLCFSIQNAIFKAPVLSRLRIITGYILPQRSLSGGIYAEK